MTITSDTLAKTKNARNIRHISQEDRVISRQDDHRIGTIGERLLYLKTREIIDELTQIMVFIQELERIGLGNTKSLAQIHSIFIKLRYVDERHEHAKIIHILSKYLMGIRRFSLTVETRGVLFYKKLFESVLAAIIWELNFSSEEAC